MSENPKRETCYSQTFGLRPIYTRGEAATFPLLNLLPLFHK